MQQSPAPDDAQHAQGADAARVEPALQDVDFDPGRTNTLTWQSGFGGIAWNKQEVPGGLRTVSDLWRPELKGRVEVLDEWLTQAPDTRYYQPEASVNRFADAPAGEHDGVVGISAGFGAAMHLLRKAADSRATLLFVGETGAGKEVFARLAHRMSPRRNEPFVAVNCAALPETLIETELFGVVKGAYTGASKSRAGRFERADGGTLFLDEVTSLSLAAQGKLLRALQEREIERVGDNQTRRVDVRVMAACNVDLRQAVDDGRFREDLYFRLTTFPVPIPPLRERRDDIPLLMAHLLRRFCTEHDKTVPGFTARAVEALFAYDFPGNVRELENIIERAVLLAGDVVVGAGNIYACEALHQAGIHPALRADRISRPRPHDRVLHKQAAEQRPEERRLAEHLRVELEHRVAADDERVVGGRAERFSPPRRCGEEER